MISFTHDSKLLVSVLQERHIWGASTHYLRVESKNQVLLELNSLCDFSCDHTIRNMYAIRILLSPCISVPESYGLCAWVGSFKDEKFKLLNPDVNVPPSSFFHNESGFIALKHLTELGLDMKVATRIHSVELVALSPSGFGLIKGVFVVKKNTKFIHFRKEMVVSGRTRGEPKFEGTKIVVTAVHYKVPKVENEFNRKKLRMK